MKVFIQIGANVGNDDFQRVIEDSSEKLNVILVEPNPALQESLLESYIDLKKIHNIDWTSCVTGNVCAISLNT
jgi:hypothetical protein